MQAFPNGWRRITRLKSLIKYSIGHNLTTPAYKQADRCMEI